MLTGARGVEPGGLRGTLLLAEFQTSKNPAAAADHALRGFLNHLRHPVRPASHVREAVVAGIESEGVADDVCDRFDFNLRDCRCLRTLVLVE